MANRDTTRESEYDMSVFQPRNRLVNFRLSEEEFERLKALCPLHGARSISDFARSSVLERLEKTPAPAPNPTATAPAQENVIGLNSKVDALETRVDQLLNLISAVGFTGAASGSTAEAPVEVHVLQQKRAD
jgi:hypothetical protein